MGLMRFHSIGAETMPSPNLWVRISQERDRMPEVISKHPSTCYRCLWNDPDSQTHICKCWKQNQKNKIKICPESALMRAYRTSRVPLLSMKEGIMKPLVYFVCLSFHWTVTLRKVESRYHIRKSAISAQSAGDSHQGLQKAAQGKPIQ